MPARRDIDSADIPALLPHVPLIHKPDGQFRFRLVGSAAGAPLFSPGHYETRPGLIYHGSVLLLPLSDDGMRVNMIIFMRIVCFFDLKGSLDRLKGARLKIDEVFNVDDAADLERRCLDWGRG